MLFHISPVVVYSLDLIFKWLHEWRAVRRPSAERTALSVPVSRFPGGTYVSLSGAEGISCSASDTLRVGESCCVEACDTAALIRPERGAAKVYTLM